MGAEDGTRNDKWGRTIRRVGAGSSATVVKGLLPRVPLGCRALYLAGTPDWRSVGGGRRRVRLLWDC